MSKIYDSIKGFFRIVRTEEEKRYDHIEGSVALGFVAGALMMLVYAYGQYAIIDMARSFPVSFMDDKTLGYFAEGLVCVGLVACFAFEETIANHLVKEVKALQVK
jgi:hypothetical protein